MQDKYVGDVGDFGKYGLLRALTREDQHLGVVWYLARPENNNDGRHLTYLEKRHEYRRCDEFLFDSLGQLARSNKRAVSAVKEAGLLPPQTVFVDRLVCLENDPGRGPSAIAARKHYRAEWMTEARSLVQNCDLVFLDPDNGIGGRSFRPHGRNGHKHAGWEEVRQFASGGTKTMVIYHHAGRHKPALEQARLLVEGYRAVVPNAGQMIAVGFRRGTFRIFLVAPSCQYEQEAAKRVDDFLQRWQDHCYQLYPPKMDHRR